MDNPREEEVDVEEARWKYDQQQQRAKEEAGRPIEFVTQPLEMTTFPVDWFVPDQAAGDYLTCTICTNVVRDPPNLETCCHAICRSCLDEWRKHKNRCPVCGVPFKAGCSFTSNPLAQSLVWRLRVRCLNHAAGCGWTGSFGMDGRSLAAHHLKCEFATVICPACNEQLTYSEFVQHQGGCHAKLIKCAHCKQEMVWAPPQASMSDMEVDSEEKAPEATAAAPAAAVLSSHPPLCTRCKARPNGCKESACPKRLVKCQLCLPSHLITWDESPAHPLSVITSPNSSAYALEQVRWMTQLPVPSSSSVF